MGKVPVLRAGDTVLFESAVICEYLDEITPPSLHPSEPLLKALNRAWIEFSSELFMDLHRMSLAEDPEKFDRGCRAAREKLERLEEQLGGGPFFNGPNFSVIDAAVAPAFMRIALLEGIRPVGLLGGLIKMQRWSDALLARESVRTSVVPEFPDLLRDYIAASESYLGREAAKS